MSKHLYKLLEDYEDINNKKFNETDVFESLNNYYSSNPNIVDNAVLAEIFAFQVIEDYSIKSYNWGIYYGPMYYNGNIEVPTLQKVDEQMLQYWYQRSKEVKNPVLKARYVSLVIEFNIILKSFDRNTISQLVDDEIISNLTTVNENYLNHHYTLFSKLKRALTLAITYNKQQLLEEVRKSIISLEKDLTYQDTDYQPLLGYNLLILNKSSKTTKEEEEEIINLMDYQITRKLTKLNTNNENPINWLKIISTLMSHYSKNKNNRFETIKNKTLLTIKNYFNKGTEIDYYRKDIHLKLVIQFCSNHNLNAEKTIYSKLMFDNYKYIPATLSNYSQEYQLSSETLNFIFENVINEDKKLFLLEFAKLKINKENLES